MNPSPPDEPVAPNVAPPSARDHLANERTFLAWLRTGIAIVILGFAIGRLSLAFPLGTGTAFSVWLGTAVIIAGVAVCIAGERRYRQTRLQLEAGDFQPASLLIEIVAIAAALFGLIFGAYLVYIGLGPS
jgi:putative membrane protein